MFFKRKTVRFFQTLGDETQRKYEKKISKYATDHASPAQIRVFEELMGKNQSCAFPAFFCLCTIYRRKKDFEKLRKLLKDYTRFRSHLAYEHIEVMYYVHSESLYDFTEVLEKAHRGAEALPDNSGYLNTFANAFATICEKCNPEDRQALMERWYRDALAAIDKAISLDSSYAKFYSTKARILALDHNYAEAASLMLSAISFEDSSKSDYVLTIMNYQYQRLFIEICRQRYELENMLPADFKAASGLGAPGLAEEEYPRPYEGAEPYAFVSYAHKDYEAVYDQIRLLQSRGFPVWYDKGIHFGSQWDEELASHISRAKVFILFLTGNSVNSMYVRREIHFAMEHDLQCLTVMMGDFTMTPGMKLDISVWQAIRKEDYGQEEFSRVLSEGLRSMFLE